MPCSTLCFDYPTNEDEKRQYGAVRTLSSHYTNVMAAFTSGGASLKTKSNFSDTSDQPNKGGVSVKHDSYIRYLNKRKAHAMAQRGTSPSQVPANNVTNNKRNKNGVGILSEKCSCQQ